MFKRLCILCAILVVAGSLSLMAQRNELLRSSLKTLTVERNGKWNSVPYIELGTRDFLAISFDDLTHEYHRYRYRVEPMTWDWKPNERLLTSEFLKIGIGDEAIEDFEESINTNVLYTNYQFKFPNEQTAVGLSGNYRLVIYDDDEEEDVAIIPFYVVENNASVAAQIETNTEIDFNDKHQQLTFTLQPTASLPVHYPETEIHTVVMQNLSWATAVVNPQPDYITPQGLKWEHNKDLIFPGSSEFHKFELVTTRYGGLGVDHIRWFDPYYHATLFTNKIRRNYVYDEDKNGCFYINNNDKEDKDLESEYIFVHFSLESPDILDGDVYVNGRFTNDQLSQDYKLQYNPETKCYENVQLLKQGYYNYQYLFVPRGQSKARTADVQGDFYQTENRYTIFGYFSQRGSRYDRLITISDFQFIPSRK